jgi:hypothetical protein
VRLEHVRPDLAEKVRGEDMTLDAAKTMTGKLIVERAELLANVAKE